MEERDVNRMLAELRAAVGEWQRADYTSDAESAAGGLMVTAFFELDRHLKQGGSLPADWDVSPAEPDFVTVARDLVRAGRKIGAIKEVRAATGMGLKEAKEYVDNL